MRMIVNQPYTNSANVLAAAMLFIKKKDLFLDRLEELWRPIPNGMALYDSFNRQIVKIGVEVPSEEADPDKSQYFSVDGTWYQCDAGLTREELDDAIQVLNETYDDFVAIIKSPIGYAYYLV